MRVVRQVVSLRINLFSHSSHLPQGPSRSGGSFITNTFISIGYERPSWDTTFQEFPLQFSIFVQRTMTNFQGKRSFGGYLQEAPHVWFTSMMVSPDPRHVPRAPPEPLPSGLWHAKFSGFPLLCSRNKRYLTKDCHVLEQ